MSVATKNPFAILDSEDASRSSSPAPAPTKGAQAPLPAQPSSRGTSKHRGGPGSRGGKYYSRGGGKAAPRDADQPQNAPEEAPAEPRKFENGRGRGRGRGRGGERGSRGGHRAFDRHSQTGKTDSDKKFHQGWGGDDGNQELKTEQAATVDAAVEGDSWGGNAPSGDWGGAAPSADWGSGDAAPAEPASAPVEEDKEGKPRREEEEDNTLTLDQYRAKEKEKETIVPKLEGPRKANDGADDSAFKDVVLLTKDEDAESYFVGKTRSTPKSRTEKKEKVFIEIDARFERPERGGRGRGRGDRGHGDRGRGDRGHGDRGERGERGRGGRGRGGGRGGRQNGPGEINVDDESAFPSLS
ncbi:hypothetical protein JOM56_006099 [Amanita muscaria]